MNLRRAVRLHTDRVTTRRALLLAMAGACALRGGMLRAQPVKLPTIGYLLINPLTEPPSSERQAFLDGLRQFGLVPDRSVRIVYRSAENEMDFLDEVARELVRENVDVIVASGPVAVLAARRATSSIPIVMLAVGDPVGAGVVLSLSRPEANVTGVSFLSSELSAKRVQLVKEIVPKARRMVILWDSRNPNARVEAAATADAAKVLGIVAVPVAVGSANDLNQALAGMSKERPDIFYSVFEGTLIGLHRTQIVEYALKQRLPLVSGWSGMTEAGGLLSYAPDISALFRRAAYYVDRILKGTPPADLPVEQPTNIELVINMRTARILGVRVPQAILLRADKVVR